eukprot:m.883327 g.883327  ORF g.883327 m.883327 type:complete len:64 (+) comp59882_c0_seq1:3653-3844(+)
MCGGNMLCHLVLELLDSLVLVINGLLEISLTGLRFFDERALLIRIGRLRCSALESRNSSQFEE